MRWWWLVLGWLVIPMESAVLAADWGGLQVQGEGADSLLTGLPDPSGRPIQPGDLDGFVEGILDRLAEQGYPFARVSLESMDSKDGRIHATLRVEPGPRSYLHGVNLKGAKVTKQDLAWKIGELQRGSLFTGEELEGLAQRLRASGYFLSVGEPRLMPGEERGQVIIELPVEEPPYTRFAGVLGVAGEESAVSGLLDLQLKNIAGTGREAHVGWQDQGRGVSRYRLRYREPWLPYLPLGGEGSLIHEVREEQYSFTKWELSAVLQAGPNWAVSGGWGGSYAVQVDTTRDNARETYARLGVEADYRDRSLNPSSGGRITLETRQGTRREGGRSFDRTRWDSEGDAYVPVSSHWLLALRTRLSYLDTPERPIPGFDLIPVGGAVSLRGYQEEQFLTHLAVTWGSEWRWSLDRRGSALYLLLDGGWVSSLDAQETNRLDTFLLGYGVGVRQATGLGSLAVEYAVPRGRSLSTGRIHLRLTADF